jgi:hypothetical protein
MRPPGKQATRMVWHDPPEEEHMSVQQIDKSDAPPDETRPGEVAQ